MNIFCDAKGNVFYASAEKIYQGSIGVNEICFIAEFPSSAQVLMAYRLPNGDYRPPIMLTRETTLDEVQTPNGGLWSVWKGRIGATPKTENGEVVKDENGNVEYDLDHTITEYSGTASVRFFVYGANGKLATEEVNFTIEKGLPIYLDATELQTTSAELLLEQILSVLVDTENSYRNISQAVDASIESTNRIGAEFEEIKEKFDEINDLENLAKGLQYAVAYPNYQAMVAALKELPADKYSVGQNILIVTLNVPDLWVSAISDFQNTVFVDDETFVNSLKKDGYVQVGYYHLSALETGKVDIDSKLDKVTALSQYDQAYVKVGQGTQTMVSISENTIGSTIVKRRSDGTIIVPSATAVSNAAISKYQSDASYVAKKTVTAEQILTMKPNGTTDSLSFNTIAAQWNIVRRDGNSQIEVVEVPTAANHAASKAYVDSVAGGGTQLYKHTIGLGEDTMGDGSNIYWQDDFVFITNRETPYTSAEMESKLPLLEAFRATFRGMPIMGYVFDYGYVFVYFVEYGSITDTGVIWTEPYFRDNVTKL